MKTDKQIQKIHEWALVVATPRAVIMTLRSHCEAPDCDLSPTVVYVNEVTNYSLCEDCANIVRFEQKYAASKKIRDISG